MRAKAGLIACLLATSAAAQTPLSAIDWLDDPAPVRVAPPQVNETLNETPVTATALAPEVTVTAIGEELGDLSVGLLSSATTGLPETLWQHSDAAALAKLIERANFVDWPALQKLLYTMMLAEAAPPKGMSAEGFLTLRAAKLTEFGAIEPAEALVEALPLQSPEHFALWFDLTLYAGLEDKACDVLNEKRALSEAYGAQIFCALRGENWEEASLLFDTADALSLLRPTERRLLLAFLDPEYAELSPDMPPPRNITPLEFRLFESIGSPLPSANLPVAFAAADLRDLAGWKAQLEAAERLVRNSALSPNALLGLYTERKPAASGGVWERARSIQVLEKAIENNDPSALGSALVKARAQLSPLGLGSGFAEIYTPELKDVELPPEGDAARFELALLTEDYESARAKSPDARQMFLASLAQGVPKGATDLGSALAMAIEDGFTTAKPNDALTKLMSDQKLGEAILTAISQLAAGAQGDYTALKSAIAGLRQMGLEDVTRRASLQIMLMSEGR